MTTTTPAATPSATAPARRRDLIAAEWLKLRSLRSTPIVLALLVPLYVYFAYDAASITHDAWPTLSARQRQDVDPGHDALPFPRFLLLMATAGTIGAMTIAGEHASGLIRTTFIAVPARGRVLLAKMVVLSGVLALLGLIIGIGAWGATFVAYSDRITGFSFGTPGVVRSIAGTTVMVPMCALIGVAAAMIVRHTAGVVFAVLVFFLLGPVAIRGRLPLLDAASSAQLVNAMPAYAWGRLTIMTQGHIVERIPSIAAAWTALAGWALAAILVPMLLRHRDV
ncbi:ABC transporter permease [Embleya sp. NPDC020886]|uniref:ABC transporter permease n=1 Tax=Embleya sp. NPDC020886 TaxID=3363980 RepID=UPI0037ADF01A